MKMGKFTGLGIVMTLIVVTAGCGEKPGSEPAEKAGVMERAGTAMNTGAEKTAEAAKKAATATKNAAGVVMEKTGEVMEKSGSAVEGAGENMQK